MSVLLYAPAIGFAAADSCIRIRQIAPFLLPRGFKKKDPAIEASQLTRLGVAVMLLLPGPAVLPVRAAEARQHFYYDHPMRQM
jgi:hypothetical protein